MESENNYNQCVNWGLWCYDSKETSKGVVLKCTMSQKRKNADGYTVPVYIDVFCTSAECEMDADENFESFVKKRINVDGQFGVSEYTSKNGEKTPTMTIWATKVKVYVNKA